MTTSNVEANSKWYKQIPTPFESQAPERNLRITLSEDGQVVEITFYAESVAVNSHPNGKDDAQKYRLIRTFEGADKTVEAPFLLIAQMDPSEDENDFNAWYNQEHGPMVAEMHGYLRGKRYEIVPDASASQPARKYLTIHEVRDLNGFTGPEALASGVTEWTKKHVGQVRGFEMTGWKLAHA